MNKHSSLTSWLAVLAVLALHGGLLAAVLLGKLPGRGVELDGEVISIQLLDTPRPGSKPYTEPKPNHPKPLALRQQPTLPVFSGLTSPISDPDQPPRSLPPQAITPLAAPSLTSLPDKSHDENLRQYGAMIWQRIIAHKPRGIHRHGTALITFLLNKQGQIQSISMARSSGDALLDARAMAAIKAASPFDPPPTDLRAEELTFTIPFDFSVNSQY
jgi:protein TonB